MRFTSSFLRNYRSAGPPAGQLERVLAFGRALLTVTGLVAIYLDPTEPTRLQAVTYAVLLAYAVYSLAILAHVQTSERVTPREARVLHGMDILWTSALTFVSEGPVSPFFLFFLFVVLAAAYRGGFRETAGTAAIVSGVFIVETIIAAINPWQQMWFASLDFDLNVTILRVTYLMLTGVLLGYLAEQEKQSRAELAAIADATRQPRVNLGLGGSITAVARMLLSTFHPKALAVVMADRHGRTLVWHMDPSDAAREHPRVRRRELQANEHADWLSPDFGPAWHAGAVLSGERVVHATVPGVWPLKRSRGLLPEAFEAEHAPQSITALNLGLADEWHGRIYLFDVGHVDDPARLLHFLERLGDHVAPALTNVVLMRRLRVRSGPAERARVARELHDGAIQSLFGIEMKLEAFRRTSDRSRAYIDREVDAMQETVRREVLALRELMQALRPIELDGSEQLPEVISGLVERFRQDTGISARFVAPGDCSLVVEPGRALEIVRIVQEALANVRRHSRARNVLVSLTLDAGTCRLVIEDDGQGFGFDGRLTSVELDEQRIGPAIIKERARLARAQLAVDSSPGSGARVELSFETEPRLG